MSIVCGKQRLAGGLYWGKGGASRKREVVLGVLAVCAHRARELARQGSGQGDFPGVLLT